MRKFELKSTLISGPVKQSSVLITIVIVCLISLITAIYLIPNGTLSDKLFASGDLVFKQHQYYRLWTTLFTHADLEHLLSNLLLFVPFSIYLINYFGILFFPLISILIGGLINYLVLLSMPLNSSLIGISGVVHLMGAAWITFYFLIDKRSKWGTRFIKSSGVAMVLFIPNTFSANISYSCHAIGFIAGILIAVLYYYIFKKQILSYELYEFIEEPNYEQLQNEMEIRTKLVN